MNKNNNKSTNKKINIIRIILIVLITINCLTIFDFSGQNGTVSGEISKKVTIDFLKVIGIVNENEENILIVEKVIRKIAHFSIYTLLGILLMCFAKTYDMPDKKRVAFCTLYVIIFASLDEFHQSFTPGRNPSVVDVFIDTIGALTGMTLILIIFKVKEMKSTDTKALKNN